MLIISNSAQDGQFYAEKKSFDIYCCHFRRPLPGMEIAPFSWVLVVSLLTAVFLLPFFFQKPYMFLLYNIGAFAIEIGLASLYIKKKREKIRQEGTKYVLNDMNADELKALKKGIMRGSVIYTSLYYHFYYGLVFTLGAMAVVILSSGKELSIGIGCALFAIELWAFQRYFAQGKYQKKVLDEIAFRLNQCTDEEEGAGRTAR